MGCASSKHHKRCRHCHRGYSPAVAPRSYSMHVHHPAQHTGDSYHMVALTSSTLESLKPCDTSLLGLNHKHLEDVSAKLLAEVSNGGKGETLFGNGLHHGDGAIEGGGTEEKEREKQKEIFDLQAKIIEAKVWSSMMNKKIPKIVPKTPVMTPPGEPETINTWELMEGLEDISPLRSPNHRRTFSFEFVRSPPNGDHVTVDRPKPRFLENGTAKPMWLRMDEGEHDSDCRVTDFDPEIIASFRKSLQELPPNHPFHIRIPGIENNPDVEFSDEHDEEDEEEEQKEGEKLENFTESLDKRSSFSRDRVVLYFTSLRGIRKTYEDCCHVRVILKSIGVRVDERDVSMHSGFKDELKELLGDKFNNGVGITLPTVFLGRKYIGGAEEMRKLNEDGKLEKLLEGFERVEDNGNGGGHECEACGDIRFVPCDTCSGSCKVYYECEEEEEEEDEEKEEEYGFQRCPDCNENGLIRCPVCCD